MSRASLRLSVRGALLVYVEPDGDSQPAAQSEKAEGGSGAVKKKISPAVQRAYQKGRREGFLLGLKEGKEQLRDAIKGLLGLGSGLHTVGPWGYDCAAFYTISVGRKKRQ